MSLETLALVGLGLWVAAHELAHLHAEDGAIWTVLGSSLLSITAALLLGIAALGAIVGAVTG